MPISLSPLTSLHFLSDVAIFAAYLSLSVWVLSMAYKMPTGFMPRMIGLGFGLFIALCGVTHANSAWAELLGYCEVTSSYSAWSKVATALVSIGVALMAWVHFLKARIAIARATEPESIVDPNAGHLAGFHITREKLREANDKMLSILMMQ